MKIHTIEQVSPNISLTPEGFLLCSNVVIGRTGVQQYSSKELNAGLEGNSAGIIQVSRAANDVFSDISINSYNGKPVTNLHPDEMVSPDNWKDVAVGVVQNVRRSSELLVADLLITEKDSIDDIQKHGLREVSCGYDAEYVQTSPGYAYQQGIVGNHVALVPRGRCGATCSIKDHAMKLSWKDKIMAFVKSNDADGLEKALDELTEPAGGDVHIHLPKVASKDADEDDKTISKDEGEDKKDAMESRVKKMEDAIADLTSKDAEKDDGESDEDTSPTADSIQSVISRAAILAPGMKFKVPTGDAKSASFKDAVCGCKLQALKAAYATDAGRSAITPFAASVDGLKGPALDAVFAGASALMGALNNLGKQKTADKSVTLDQNKINADFWANRK